MINLHSGCISGVLHGRNWTGNDGPPEQGSCYTRADQVYKAVTTSVRPSCCLLRERYSKRRSRSETPPKTHHHLLFMLELSSTSRDVPLPLPSIEHCPAYLRNSHHERPLRVGHECGRLHRLDQRWAQPGAASVETTTSTPGERFKCPSPNRLWRPISTDRCYSAYGVLLLLFEKETRSSARSDP